MSDIRLRDFLVEGSVIRTKHYDNSNWVTNIVYNINEDYIEIDIGLEKDYVDNLIMVGDTMKCKYTSNENEYSLIGWVSRIKADFPQSITIKVHEIEEFDNKRSSYRYDVYLCSIIKEKSEDEKGIFSILTNISRTGAAFIVKENLDNQLQRSDMKQKSFFFEIYISPEKKLNFTGSVKRKTNNIRGIEYGIQIDDISINNEKILNDFIDELENKDKEIYNKRSSFWSKNSKYKGMGGSDG